MADIPNTRFINFVDTPVTVAYTQAGSAHINLDSQVAGVIDVTGFRTISIRIGTTKATSFDVIIGKVSGSTLAQAFSFPMDQKIHTVDVVGPQMTLWFKGGVANTQEKVQMWVYLRS